LIVGAADIENNIGDASSDTYGGGGIYGGCGGGLVAYIYIISIHIHEKP
jgi:hypothetical protein